MLPTSRKFLIAAAGLTLSAAGRPAYTEEPEPEAGKIQIHGLSLDVLRGARLAYRIQAAEGQLEQETRIVHLANPQVDLFGGAANERQDQIKGAAGRLWPVKIKVETTEQKPGAEPVKREREETRYDWELTGAVQAESTQGYLIKTEKLNFASASGTMSSKDGIQYRLPTGRGTLLAGNAREFEAEIDRATGAIKRWTLTSKVSMVSTKDEEKKEPTR